jgi:hypothetical protein
VLLATGLFLAPARCIGAEPPPGRPAGELRIGHVDIVHFSHTDYGFTDHPAVCRELQRRYLDIALDAALATRERPPEGRFAWTAETTVAVADWWESASPARRDDFLAMVRAGQLEVTALPLNQTPTLSRRQWQQMLHWLPDDLWREFRPCAAVQNDVNGTPRAGAAAMLDRGVKYLFSGINEDSGGAPLRRPSAFWWKLPDGRKMFVWLGYSYPTGFYFFEPASWRRGPVPQASDTRYRPARPGDFLRSDDDSVRRAHGHLVGRLRAMEAEGYAYPSLVISITNEWRMDNDPPFPALADFVAAWNRLGLKPTVRLTTVSQALKRLEGEIGDRIPAYEGEWTDWWANGAASGPREVAASRWAKRLAAAAESPLWGEPHASARRAIEAIYRDLCLFDEHTWGNSDSVAVPYSLETLGQFNEKARLAYRPLAMSRWLLAQRVRTRLTKEPDGFYVANTAKLPFSGWIAMPATCLRDGYRSLADATTRAKLKIHYESGCRPFTRPAGPEELTPENTAATFPDNCPGQTARFWLESLAPAAIVRFLPGKEDVAEQPAGEAAPPKVEVDAQGWPATATWEAMKRPLFTAGMGDFQSVSLPGFAPRWIARDIWTTGDESGRAKLRAERLVTTAATSEAVVAVENPHTLVYRQRLSHPRLRWATRELELWRREPRARLTVRFYRQPSEDPEAFFVRFPLGCEGAKPRTSCGGMPFVPFEDQIPGVCRDHFAVDSWVRYAAADGAWVWATRDAPLVAFDEPQVLARRRDPPARLDRVLAMVYNNFWYTNFVADVPGVMEFQFDLAWRPELDDAGAEQWSEVVQSDPPLLIQPALTDDPFFPARLWRP